MKSRHQPRTPSRIVPWCLALPCIAGALHAHAEAPMHTDDAGTLAQGALKLEGTLGRDAKTRSSELLFGMGLLPGLEMEVSLAHGRDTGQSPATTLQGRGWGVKWVPIQNDAGWSLGARADLGHTRVRDDATPAHFSERAVTITGLATYRFANDQALHLNAGHHTVRVQGVRHRAATWAVGHELPLTAQLRLTSEVFGEQRSRPDKALGLRYEIAEGLKASVAVGRGNGRNFSQMGLAWEF